jgi:hypothetical protein
MPKIIKPERIHLAKKRLEMMIILFNDGYTFADISNIFYCDRSWVKNLIDKHHKYAKNITNR